MDVCTIAIVVYSIIDTVIVIIALVEITNEKP